MIYQPGSGLYNVCYLLLNAIAWFYTFPPLMFFAERFVAPCSGLIYLPTSKWDRFVQS